MVVNLILLAAGFSRRYKGNKLLHIMDGKPMYQHILHELSDIVKEDSENYRLVVVTQYKEIYNQANGLPLVCVMNQNSLLGISSSLKLGLRTAKDIHHIEKSKCEYNTENQTCTKADDSCYIFFVADQPYLKKETIYDFIEQYKKQDKGIACMSFDGQPGNPCAFSEKYVQELLELEGDVGGRKVINRHLEDIYYYPVRNKKELEDIDS